MIPSEVYGVAFYDEDGMVRWISSFHFYPGFNREGHIPSSSCVCVPVLTAEDSDGCEVWRHDNGTVGRAN